MPLYELTATICTISRHVTGADSKKGGNNHCSNDHNPRANIHVMEVIILYKDHDASFLHTHDR